ncbi:MAG TPA: hypothetical protein VM032_08760 [Vicinamibacterales bacterium]|nr:hypothetical protein [Vicinamibacterales bacterium]
MPRIQLNLDAMTAARAELGALESQRRVLDADLADAQAALERARGAGASPNVTVPLEQRIEAARARRNEARLLRTRLSSRIDDLAAGLLQGRDPSQMIEALDGGRPIALLPVRLETRYVPVGAPTSLRIRVYPDDLNTVEHVAALTPAELAKGRAYWEARFTHADHEAARLLRDLTVVFGRGRAAMIVRVLTPLNALPDEGVAAVPTFPEPETIDSRAVATRAVLLPDRWCAIGYAAPQREVFRIWGNRIPDELLLSPDWLATDQPETLLGGDRAWMVDFDAALAKGMALQITQQELNRQALRDHAVPFNLAAATLERLVVVGIEWTKTAEESVADLTDLLAAHRDSTGLGFAELGTPTNNTESQASGYSPSEDRTTAVSSAANSEKDALQLLTWAFGITPDALPADNIAGAHLADQRTALHMMNALWRGTFGHYLFELWNPDFSDDDSKRFLKTRDLYNTRWYAVRYLRPSGALPLLRVGKQPYGILPIVGKRFVTSGSAVESRIGAILGVLRPMWELATRLVPTMTDGDVDKARQILQTSAWSQVARYRDKDAGKAMCVIPTPFSEAQGSGRRAVIHALLTAAGVSDTKYNLAHIYNCNDFLPDPPYEAGPLVGVPWVMADSKDPKKEADDRLTLGDGNYLEQIAGASIHVPDAARPLLNASQSGPALLQALVSYSVQMEQGDAVERFVVPTATVDGVTALRTPAMPFVEARDDNEAMFTIETPRELAAVVIPSVTGAATLGEHVSRAVSVPIVSPPVAAHRAATALDLSVHHLLPQTRDLGAVKVSLDYLSDRTVGELNIAFRSTLDAFSYRLDAWISARANRRLEQMRERSADGVYVGGVAWVEHLKADRRPDSDGHLLAPSLGQAATAAILRSGFLANHEAGAFDIALDSERTQRATGLLQGLARDQPLAALYGYRIERGLRDALLGRFIWPLRLAFPWRPAGQQPSDESREAIGARDVVDGVALLAAREQQPPTVRARLQEALDHLAQAPAPISADEWNRISAIIDAAAALADSVSDLLLAEGTHQIVQGNLDRAAAAMAIVDKQSLPIETAFNTTDRGSAGYTQRLVAICPADNGTWPSDDRALAEPAVNAWLASMLGDPARYRFVTAVHRGVDVNGDPVVDAVRPVVPLSGLGLSPLSAVLLSAVPSAPHVSTRGETGLRRAIVGAFIAALVNPGTVTGLDVALESDDATRLGLGHFEAIATTLKAVIDKARPAARFDLVAVDDALEPAVPGGDGQFPGVDVAEIVARADAAEARFAALAAAVVASADAASLLPALAALDAYLPSRSWPAEVFAIDADGAAPAQRDARALTARDAVMRLLDARQDALGQPIALMEDQLAPTDGQRVQHGIDRIKLLFGRDFPVLPRFTLGPYAGGFAASLGDQPALTVNDPWRINGWLTQLGCVREGANRYASAMAAHEALVSAADAGDFTVVQFPHRAGQPWAALPEAWIQPAGEPPNPKDAPPEELKAFLADRPGAKYRNVQRTAPTLAIACHCPGRFAAPAAETALAALVCDEWPEFIPDPFQTAGIAFHYDAPGARPPQAILLALPPRLDQEAWTFDDLLDVIHEAVDLAKLRAVRPQDLKGGLGALLPGNYLPQSYTDHLPSVQLLKMRRDAMDRLVATSVDPGARVFTLGKV